MTGPSSVPITRCEKGPRRQEKRGGGGERLTLMARSGLARNSQGECLKIKWESLSWASKLTLSSTPSPSLLPFSSRPSLKSERLSAGSWVLGLARRNDVCGGGGVKVPFPCLERLGVVLRVSVDMT
jgi:hypothetical protein